MRLPVAFFSLLLSVLTLAVDVQAQPFILKAGERIRVFAPAINPGPVVGQVSALTAESLVLVTKKRGLKQLTIPLHAIERVDVSRGLRRHTRTGALIGALIGGVGWVALSSTVLFDPSCREDRDAANRCGAIFALLLYGTPFVSAAGALVGAWGGSLIRTERWRTLSLQTRVGLTSRPGVSLDSGLPLTMSVRLAWVFG